MFKNKNVFRKIFLLHFSSPGISTDHSSQIFLYKKAVVFLMPSGAFSAAGSIKNTTAFLYVKSLPYSTVTLLAKFLG
jgi:hypothetical protein